MENISQRTKRIMKQLSKPPIVEFSDSSSDGDFSSTDSLKDPAFVPPIQSEFDSTDDKNHRPSELENIQSGEDHAPVSPLPSPHSPSGSSEDDIPLAELRRPIVNNTWSTPTGRQQQFDFTGTSGINPSVYAQLVDGTPYDFYSALIDNIIIDQIVDQTNLYATQKLTSEADISKSSRWHKWVPTNRNEIKRFLGLIGYMGLVKMTSIENYWSSNPLYRNDIAKSTMSRNRFQLLLQALHFDDNETCPPNDRLHKIQKLVDLCVHNFQLMYTPNKVFCIDESMVPFQGRLLIKQYIPQKTHRYGIKLFKLCCETGYTWNLSIYCGKAENRQHSLATDVVLNLAGPLLDSGRIIITDNFYTSIELANILLERKTHLLGTLRKNRRGNPKEVINKMLKKGEMISRENLEGITVTKWRDKRDVLMLSSCHADETSEIIRRTGPILKPKSVIDYNSGKASIDLSDQLASYGTALRRSLKWYRKLAIELLLGMAVVNARFLYISVTSKNIKVNDFREHIIKELLQTPDEIVHAIADQPTTSSAAIQLIPTAPKRKHLATHKFMKRPESSRIGRKYCRGCYQRKKNGEIPKSEISKVTTYCSDCVGEPPYCLKCFNEKHYT